MGRVGAWNSPVHTASLVMALGRAVPAVPLSSGAVRGTSQWLGRRLRSVEFQAEDVAGIYAGIAVVTGSSEACEHQLSS